MEIDFPPNIHPSTPLVADPLPVATTPYELKELDIALNVIKRNKCPGPDEIEAEYWAYLDTNIRANLASLSKKTSYQRALVPRT